MRLTKKQWALIAYIPLFYLTWAGVELGLMPLFEQTFPPDSTALFLIKEGLLKVLLWIVPAVLLIRKFDDGMHVRLKEMFTNRFNWKQFALMLVGLVALLIVNHLVMKHDLHFTFKWNLLGFLLVGITEEIAFRAWMLNAMYTDKTRRYMLEVNAVMFLMIHLPVWIREDMLGAAFAGFGFLSILGMGLVFAWSFIYFRSIWPPIILHTVYDMLVTVLS